jgi:hypothetical protein
MFKHMGGSRFPLATDYEDQSPDELVFPEDLSTLADDEVTGLLNAALEGFQDIYGDGSSLTEEQIDALANLKDNIESVRAEQGKREEAAQERSAEAAKLAKAAGIDPEAPKGEEFTSTEGTPDAGTAPDASEIPVDAPAAPAPEVTPAAEPVGDALVAGATPTERRVSLKNLRRPRQVIQTRNERPADQYGNRDARDILKAAPNVPGLISGEGVDIPTLATALDTRMRSFPMANYQSAAKRGTRLREQHNLAIIQKPQDARLTINSNDPAHVAEVISYASDEKRLPGGSLIKAQSLTASGGWCAPSETIYDLCELESRDGLLSLPEITITRGGLQYTQGPDFSTIFNNSGFCYTEAEDIAGDYDGEGGGSKPCYRADCPGFLDDRLGLCGVCVESGLLQSRGFPELLARSIRGVMIAHDHRVSARLIQEMINGSPNPNGHDGSTAVTMPATQVGATAPILTAIELQVEHMRYLNRMSRTATIEAIFPYWVRGAIRADLSRRLGVDLLSVSNEQIAAWFAQRGVAPQYVYDWQDIATTAASGFTQYPDTVDFLLFPAGTWLRGSADIITLDNIYDSVNLGGNDFIALFTEEGLMTIKMCHDSRVVTVGICPDGATAAGVDIACDGTAVEVG